MKNLNYYFTKTRWLVTIILLMTFSIGQMLAADPSWTYSFTAAPSISSHQFTVNSATWTESTTVGKGSPSIASGNDNSVTCVKFGSGKNNYYSNITLSTDYFADYNIKSVYIVGCVNANSVSITATQGTGVGAVTIGTATISQAYAASWPSNANCQKTMNTNQGSGGTLTISISPTTCAFSIKTITVTYTTVACTDNPTNSGASLNGAFNAGGVTSLTNIADVFSCSGSSAGSNCSYSENGFVWSSTASTAGTLQKGSSGVTYISGTTPNGSGAFTGTLAGTWSTGVTYYYRSYVKNNGNNIKYYPADGVNSFIPLSVTFNSNGGSSVDTKYVRSGGTVTAPSDPTKTGYTFGGWYTDNGTFESSVNWSSTIDANTTYYAKWTVKTYNITLDREGATTGSTSVTMTYNSSSHTAITAPSKDGYTFGGWWSGDNGTGTMVMNADGVLQANVTNYTGAGGVWTKDATCTLYAKWTVINYAITWMVDGVEWSGKGGSTGADYGTAWSALTLPTAPGSTELTSCSANKFVGWTTHEIATPLDKTSDAAAITTMRNTDLLNSDNKASKTSTYITGATTFYAVFADYAE